MPQGLAIATVDVSFPLLAPNGSAAAPSYSFAAATGNGMYADATRVFLAAGGSAGLYTYGSVGVVVVGTLAFSTNEDVILVRDAANVLAQRNGVNAQKFRVYNTYTNAGENEYLEIRCNAGAEYQILSVANGTGTARAISILPGGSNGWAFVGDKILPSTTGTFSIGATTQRVKDLYLGGNTPAASAPMLDLSQTWNDAGVTFVGAKIVITDTASAAGSKPWQILGGGGGATNLLYVTGAGDLVSGGSITAGNPFFAPDGSSGSPSYAFTSDTNTGFWRFGSGRIAVEVDGADILAFRVDGDVQVATGSIFGWNAASNFNNAPDLGLARLAAASLRLGLAPSATPVAQTFTIGEFSRVGTDSNVAGSDGTIRSGSGTGNAAGSSLFFDTPTVGASGTVQQSYGHRLTLSALGATFDIPDQGLRINNQVNGAGASAGSLTNAPSAGNPNFWLPINIAGTVRYFPGW